MNADELKCPLCDDWHPQGSYAFAKLLERLALEGYVRDERKAELMERARNLRAGKGFLTDAELEAERARARQQTPRQENIEDLLS